MISYHLLLFLLLLLTSIAPSYGTDCPTLSSPQNGRVSIIGTYASYSCNTGYTLRGISFRTCSNGRWSGSAPTCEIACPTLSSPQNGSVSVTGTFASYSCNNGYTLSGFSFRTCSNGRWSGTAPTCVLSCPTLDSPQNGRVLVRTYGTIFALYYCNTGYELRGSSIRPCVGGRWTGSVPTCEYQDGLSPEGTTQGSSFCSTLSSPQNGTVSITGTIATYSCNRGYTLRGSSSRFCNAGRWSSSTPTCVALSASSNGCSIKANSPEAVGTPYYQGSTPRSYDTYSCLDYNNCSYSVHVLGVYEASSNHRFGHHPTYNSYVYISTTGSGDTRPLVLVLSSYEPINWNLRIPTNLVFDKVIVSSYYDSEVVCRGGRVLEVEKDLNFFGYGSDTGGGQTQELLQAISQRLNPVTSFTGTYQADRWDLNIDRNVPTSSQCPQVEASVTTDQNSGSSLCSTLSSPQNGAVSIMGTIATYSCNRGYTLRGSSSRFCNGGRWSSSTPACVALSSSNGCSIKANSPEAAGTPYYQGSAPRSYKTYSCLDYNNCSYSVHVLGVYEASSNHGFGYHPTHNSYVYISTTGSGDTRPLVLVLSSYEPVNWNLRMPTNLVFDKVIVSSYHESEVTYASGQVLEVEKDLNFSGYGSDSGGGQTQKLLQAISQRLSPVTSFTGTYQADRWDLNIDRNVPTSSQCPQAEASVTKDNSAGIITITVGVVVILFQVAVAVIYFVIKKIRKKNNLPTEDTTSPPSYSEACRSLNHSHQHSAV